MVRVGAVTVVHGRHAHLEAQRRTLERAERRPDLHVVVAISDPGIAEVVADSEGLPTLVVPIDTDPLGLPLAAARNWGMDVAGALGCEVLVGLDVDCLVGPRLIAGYVRAIGALPRRLWSGPVTYLPPPSPGGYPLDGLDALDAPHAARPAPPLGTVVDGGDPVLFWSLSYAVSAEVWTRVGGYDEVYVGYGAEDTDFARRAARAGVGLAWAGDARAYHQYHPVTRPPTEHLDDILRNGRAYRDRWGEWPMSGWLDEFERLGLVVRRGADYHRVVGRR